MAARIDIDPSSTAYESVTKQLERQDNVLKSINVRWNNNINLAKVAATVAKDEVKLAEKLSNVQNSIEAKTKEIAFWENQRLHHATAVAGMGTVIRAEQSRILKLLKEEYNERDRINALLEREKGNLLIMQKSGLQGLIDKTKEWNTMIKANPLLIAGAAAFKTITYSFKQIWDIFDKLDSAASDFRKSMGIVRTQSSNIETVARGIAIQFMGIGVSAKDVYESFKAISETAGSTRSYTVDMVKDMSMISAQFGITAQTSAKFLKTMAMVSTSTMSTQKDMLLVAQRMSAAAGVPLDAVMQDVAAASERGYQFLSREPLILLKSAIQAKLLGTNLQASSTSAASLLNFTESVNSEMEASVLLGRSLNLQRARELAYRRDIEGLNKEIVKLAKEANFEQLDPFQQNAVAKALGKQTGEIAAMLESDREHSLVLRAMSATERQRYDALMNINKSQIKNYAELARKEIQTISNQKAMTAITQAWSAIFAKLGEAFLPAIASTLEWVAKTLNSMSSTSAGILAAFIAISGVIGVIVGAGYLGKFAGLLGGSGGILSRTLSGISTGFSGISKGISNAVKEIVKSIKSVMSLIGTFGTEIGKFIGGLIGKSIEGILGGIARGLKVFEKVSWPAIAKGSVAILALGAALIPFAFAMSLMKGIDWKTLGVAAAGLVLFTAAAFGLGALMMGPGAILFGAGVIAIAALGLALLPLSISAEKAGKAMVNLGNGFKSVVDSFVVLQSLSFIGTILQLYNLTDAILSVSDAINKMPDMKIEKLKSITLPTIATSATTPVGGEKDNKQNETLIAIKDGIEALRSDMKNGVLTATVFLDSQKLDKMTGRRMAFTGELS